MCDLCIVSVSVNYLTSILVTWSRLLQSQDVLKDHGLVAGWSERLRPNEPCWSKGMCGSRGSDRWSIVPVSNKQVKPGFTNYQPRGLAIWNKKIKQFKNSEIIKTIFNRFPDLLCKQFFKIRFFWKTFFKKIKFCDDLILLNDQNDVIKAKKVKVGWTYTNPWPAASRLVKR